MKVIITGTTGMIGEGVLLACLDNAQITEILSVSRKPTNKSHPKLKEMIVADFLSLRENEAAFQAYDACFFCAGISSVGKSEVEFTRIAHDTTLNFARAFGGAKNKTFIYVSGTGTDSSEQGKLMWARVKGRTENELFKMPFKQAFGYRIGFVKPYKGQEHVLKLYAYLSWLFPFIETFFASAINTMEEVAKSMIYVSENGYDKNVILVKDIQKTSQLLAK
jgi:uncharacterized protein YbjT (DUF2867 family)